MIGEGKLLDPSRYFIICFNSIGSCYGSTGPETNDPRNGLPYKSSFPVITIRDIARSTLLALDSLGIDSIALAIGGSMGGMVVLELAVLDPKRFKKIVPIAVGATHTAWRLAFSSTIRRTITEFAKERGEDGLREGMKLARAIGMVSYRSSQEFDTRFARERISDEPKDRFDPRNLFEVERYLEHQGEKIVERFSPYCYLTLTRAMELYDLSQGRSSNMEATLSQIEAETLVIGISSDVLYPEQELRELASGIPGARYATLNAIFGHDSFLIATAELARIITPFLSEAPKKHIATRSSRKSVRINTLANA
jgi:homoserine O-acetyltransferase/O-succinyltransferase